MVETNSEWVAEAVWDGPYEDGDFDHTDLVFGTGIRIRGDALIIVSSGSTVDRLWYCHHEGMWQFSNSLPALLSVAGLELRDDYLNYSVDVDSIRHGLSEYKRTLPVTDGDVHTVFYSNLYFDGLTVKEIDKPTNTPDFKCYEDYSNYLVSAAKRLGDNLHDPCRETQIVPLATLSQGYDSTAAAVIATYAGCKKTVTISKSTSLWRGSDSGEVIAHALGVSCDVISRTAKHYPFEEAIWATSARAGTLNWSLFRYPEPLCVLFTGSYGDKVWARSHRKWADPFAGTTLSHGGIGEFRLFQGVFHCPVPFWGMRAYRKLQDISFTEEMGPWTLNTDYDRPIPRRISEEAGVPREAFGIRKKNTSTESAFLWPYSRDSQTSFRAYLQARGIKPPGFVMVSLFRWLAKLDNLIYGNIIRRFGLPDFGLRHRLGANFTPLLFQWANAELRKIYQARVVNNSQQNSKAGEMSI
jgi:hypothetical protein